MPGDLRSLQSNGRTGSQLSRPTLQPRSQSSPSSPRLPFRTAQSRATWSFTTFHTLGTAEKPQAVTLRSSTNKTSHAQRRSEMGVRVLQGCPPASRNRSWRCAWTGAPESHLRNSNASHCTFSSPWPDATSGENLIELDVAYHVSTTGT